jgi:hypothetical protein
MFGRSLDSVHNTVCTVEGGREEVKVAVVFMVDILYGELSVKEHLELVGKVGLFISER